MKDQGYQITTGENELVIRAKGEAGLFYGTQTLLQLIMKDLKAVISSRIDDNRLA